MKIDRLLLLEMTRYEKNDGLLGDIQLELSDFFGVLRFEITPSMH